MPHVVTTPLELSGSENRVRGNHPLCHAMFKCPCMVGHRAWRPPASTKRWLTVVRFEVCKGEVQPRFEASTVSCSHLRSLDVTPTQRTRNYLQAPKHTLLHCLHSTMTSGYEDYMTAPIALRQCYYCGKPESEQFKLKKCARCSLVVYCSKECQKKHWSTHK